MDNFKVWVSTFGLYNAGALHGYWVDAADAPETIEEFTAGLRQHGMPAMSEYVGEELHCFDTDNSPIAGEMHPSTARAIAGVLETIDEDQRAAFYAVAADLSATTPDDLETIATGWDDFYGGEWDSIADYAGELLDSTGMLDELPEWAKPYSGALIESFAHDMRLSGEVSLLHTTDGTSFILRNY